MTWLLRAFAVILVGATAVTPVVAAPPDQQPGVPTYQVGQLAIFPGKTVVLNSTERKRNAANGDYIQANFTVAATGSSETPAGIFRMRDGTGNLLEQAVPDSPTQPSGPIPPGSRATFNVAAKVAANAVGVQVIYQISVTSTSIDALFVADGQQPSASASPPVAGAATATPPGAVPTQATPAASTPAPPVPPASTPAPPPSPSATRPAAPTPSPVPPTPTPTIPLPKTGDGSFRGDSPPPARTLPLALPLLGLAITSGAVALLLARRPS